MQSIISYTLLIAHALFPLVASQCTKFDIARESYTRPTDGSFITTKPTNCTGDLARSDGGKANTCEIPGYAMGIIAHPENNLSTKADVQKHVISLLANLAPAVGTTVDFNDTIVMNYTNMYTSYNVNQTGYYAYTPILTCWDGRLSDCGDQKELEGKSGRICGYTWLGKDASALPRGKQQYDGIEMFVTSNSLGNVNGDGVLPRYDDVADQATLTHLGGENGGGKSIASTWDLSFPALAIAVSCSVASNFL